MVYQGEKSVEGKIFDIQRYSIHNGPGIRTTVFFKGCPLSCWWCHNPEGQRLENEVLFLEQKGCMGCGDCILVCPKEAVSPLGPGRLIDSKACIRCGSCIKSCPTQSLQMVGESISPEDLILELEKDRIFYDASGGGVTLSGGEPFFQVEFLDPLLSILKKGGFHVAVDTSGYTTREVLSCLHPNIHLFLYDLKHLDEKIHTEHTGVSNRQIIENLLFLSSIKAEIQLRLPLIPGFNDDEEHLKELAHFVTSLHLNQIHLLPYHRMAAGKYSGLQKREPLPIVDRPTQECINRAQLYLENKGLHCIVGG